MRATVHFDGACSRNPGPMGLGAVVAVDGRPPKILSLAGGHGTNNQAEYRALIMGLRHALADGVTDVTAMGDSELVLRQLKGEYKVRKPELQPLFEEASGLLRKFASHRLQWVPREQNEAADLASKKAIGLA